MDRKIFLLVDVKGATKEEKQKYILDRISLYNGESDLRELGACKNYELRSLNLETTQAFLNDNISIVIYEYSRIEGLGDCVKVYYKHNNIIYTIEY